MRNSLEREAKLEAWPGFAIPDLNLIAQGVTVETRPPQQLSAVYYDTADLRLARWGVTVRHRKGGEDAWTVKLPTNSQHSTLVRREISFDGGPGTIPKVVRDLVTAYLRSDVLIPVARLRTHRQRLLLVDEAGSPVLEVADDEVSVYEGRHLANRFREIEVEVTGERGQDFLDAVVKALVDAGASPGVPVPKVIRALGTRAAEPPELVIGPLAASASVRDLVARAVAQATAAILAHDPGVRIGDDPEDVHQARVAARTLRSNLQTFHSVLQPEWAAGLRRELSWLGHELGAVRDADVLGQRLTKRFEMLSEVDRPACEALLQHVWNRRQEARHRLLASLSSDRYVELLDRLFDATENPRLVDETDNRTVSVMAGLAEKPWRQLERGVREAGTDPPDEVLHDLRIRAKKCRYAAEAAAEIVGGPARRMARAIADLQTVLGDHQDAVIAEAWLRREAEAGLVDPLVAGALIMLARQEAEACRRQWRPVWKRAKDKRLRSWMKT